MVLNSTPAEIIIEPADFAQALAIRRAVFIVEQRIDEALEIDAFEENCRHYVARRDGVVVGAARLRPYGDRIAKIERMAVLAPHRRAGVGRALLERMEADAERDRAIAAVLHAQDHALGFYARCGYLVEGEGFEEAGIPHHRMGKTLRPK